MIIDILIDLGFNHATDLTHTIWDKGWVTPAGLYTGRADCGNKDPYLDDDGVPQCAGVRSFLILFGVV